MVYGCQPRLLQHRNGPASSRVVPGQRQGDAPAGPEAKGEGFQAKLFVRERFGGFYRRLVCRQELAVTGDRSHVPPAPAGPEGMG